MARYLKKGSEGVGSTGADVRAISRAESLPGHAISSEIRLKIGQYLRPCETNAAGGP